MTTERLQHHTSSIDMPEAVGVFDYVDSLQAAIYDLLAVAWVSVPLQVSNRYGIRLGSFPHLIVSQEPH